MRRSWPRIEIQRPHQLTPETRMEKSDHKRKKMAHVNLGTRNQLNAKSKHVTTPSKERSTYGKQKQEYQKKKRLRK